MRAHVDVYVCPAASIFPSPLSAHGLPISVMASTFFRSSSATAGEVSLPWAGAKALDLEDVPAARTPKGAGQRTTNTEDQSKTMFGSALKFKKWADVDDDEDSTQITNVTQVTNASKDEVSTSTLKQSRWTEMKNVLQAREEFKARMQISKEERGDTYAALNPRQKARESVVRAAVANKQMF